MSDTQESPGRRGGVHQAREGQGRTSVSRERGAGTVVVLALAAVVVLLALAVGALGAAQRARGTAQAAADLGALAAATAWRHGADPCATATEAVHRNGGQVVACVPEDGGVVGVRASRAAVGPEVGPWAGALGAAGAHARAGPRPGVAPVSVPTEAGPAGTVSRSVSTSPTRPERPR